MENFAADRFVSGAPTSATTTPIPVAASSGDDDSDGDLITDFLSSNGTTTNNTIQASTAIANNTNPFLNNYNNENNIVNNNYNNNNNNSNSRKNSTSNSIKSSSSSITPPTSASATVITQAFNIFHNQNFITAQQQQQPQNHHNYNNQYNHQHTIQNIPLINIPNNSTVNMVPIISVTPHSPGAKYSSILDDSLSHLQNIRESVVQMKNSTVHMQGFMNSSLVHSAVLSSSRMFSSCPSLSDLSAANANCNMWSPQQYLINSDRRKSWTAIEDLTECTNKSSHKSVSLSSLDSEEQESIRVAERHRSNRNSTGGISTHSLNEAELARDFERIAAKRNLAPTLITRIPLQKSISTPSIAPLRIPGAKEESNITTTRHLSDSEDDNQDDRSLLCVRDKIEVYADHPEKRRKRGSLFFRKKKDKTKTKGQSTNCDACGATINLSTVKDHALECKALKKPSKSGSGKNKSTTSGKKMTGCYSPWRLVANKLGVTSHHASHTSHHDDNNSRDYYEGHSHNEHSHFPDDTPLIRVEFLNEPPIGPHDLGADPLLGIALEEHDSWSPSVPKEIVKSLKDKQVKRQEHIYEFIMTEKHHCQTLLVIQKVFVESLQRHFSRLNIDRMFPRLPELTELHTSFLKKLRQKQRENYVVDSIADVLLDFLSSISAQRLKSAYGEFCSNHRSALDKFKYCMTSDQTFAEWYKHCLTNSLLKKKGIPECILFVTQRLTKYPLLIDPLLKSSREDRIEQEKLQKAMALVKGILIDVDARVAEKEKQDRQLEIFKSIDVKSFALYKNKQFRKSDIGVGTSRKLKFEGYATLMQGRSKMQNVMVVVLSDCLFFLQENSHNKYTFFTPENKAGVVSLQKLLIREKAGTESRGIYIISSNPAFPEMYELKVQNPKDKNIWIQAIRAAVLECPSDDMENDDLTAEQKQKLIDEKQATIRELIEKMRQKDIEQALLLEEKILLQLALLKDKKNIPETAAPKAEEFLLNFGSYKDLITDDCDTIEIWKRVLNTVQEITQLASTLYTAATGLPVSRSTSSVGEKQSDAYASPILPKRAETFGGFDERRTKNNIPWRDAVLSTLPMSPLPVKDNQHLYTNDNRKDSIHSTISTVTTASSNQYQLSEFDTNSNTISSQNNALIMQRNCENISLKDNNYAALQVSHHLHTLLCIISQQMTTIHNLQAQLTNYRDNPKTIYKHNDQLEELRNLQDKLQEEKQIWLKQKEQQERDLDEQRKAQEILQKQIKTEQEDIKQQRDQLYRKMEILSSQGLLLSPNTPLPNVANVVTSSTDESHPHSSDEHNESTLNDRRKDKWRSTSIPKNPPVNLLSATNAPKVNQANVKQQIPMKLSSLSSTKSEKTPISSNNITSPINNTSGITQMFPLKLADKKNQNMTPNHSRTGSSPAIIQQLPQQAGNPAIRTNTYPKLPERYRLRNSDVGINSGTINNISGNSSQIPTPHQSSSTTSSQSTNVQSIRNPNSALNYSSSMKPSTNSPVIMKHNNSSNITGSSSSSSSNVGNSQNPDKKKQKKDNAEEEEIYF